MTLNIFPHRFYFKRESEPAAGIVHASVFALNPLHCCVMCSGLEGDGGGELLRLAVGQRMNTDARRAAFCAVMGSEDCADAFERLLRLGLKVRQCD